MLRYLEITLKRAGFQVTTAQDGADGLQKSLSTDFDLIAADLTMPQMNGDEMFRILRNLSPTCPKLILLSGSEFELNEKENSLANVYLIKNTDLSENLVAAVNNLISDYSDSL